MRVDSILELQNYKNLSFSVEEESIDFIKMEDNWWLHPTKEGKFLCGTYKYCYVENFKSKKVNLINNYYYFKPLNLKYYVEVFSE